MEQIWSPHFPLLPTPVWKARNEEDGQKNDDDDDDGDETSLMMKNDDVSPW